MARTKRKTNPVIPAAEAPAQAQKQYRAAAYARLSVEDSGKPGADTIEGQKNLLLRFIKNDPTLTLYGLFCDNGKTGTDFQRPEFEKLMEAVKRGEVDCIVVKDLSRFGRNYKETGNYLERIFPFLGVRFIAVNDGFDTLTAQRGTDGYLVPLKNLINEVYSKDISRKSGSALAAKQKNGDFIGAWAPYGYRKCPDDPHKLEPDEATAPVVRQIFRWRAEGIGVTQIARRLNDEGVPSPSAYLYNTGVCKTEKYNGVIWYVQTVKNILSRQVYIGHMSVNHKNPTKVVTGVVRLSYANVWEPASINGSNPKYSVSLIIPKTDTKTIDAINAAVDAAIKDGAAKFGGKIPNKAALKLPLRDGDLERDDEAYKGAYFVNANSTTAPQIVDRSVQPILDRAEVYSGCYARVSINFYAFNSNGNRGIACGLGNIQKVRDGEPLGGRSSAADDFSTDFDDDFLS